MKIWTLDLEMDKKNGEQPIIEIGVAVFDVRPNDFKLIKSINILVDHGQEVDGFIVNYTGITTEMLKSSDCKSVKDAYFKIKNFVDGCFMNPIVWGKGDAKLFREQAGIKTSDCFMGFRFIDAKDLHQSYQMSLNKKIKGGLETSLKVHGMNFDEKFGKPHRALADAYNTGIIWNYLTKKMTKA